MNSTEESGDSGERRDPQPVFQMLDDQAERGHPTGRPPACEEQGHDYERPPLLVKLTGYRLLTLFIILTFGTAKAIESLHNDNFTATWLDWVAGAGAAVIIYWIGLYEKVRPPKAPWFFHTDYTREVFYIPFGTVICASISFVTLGLLYLYRLGSALLFKAIPEPIPDGPQWKFPVAVLLSMVLGLTGFVLISTINVLILAGLFNGTYHLVQLMNKHRDFYQVLDIACNIINGYCHQLYTRPITYTLINAGGGIAISVFVWIKLPTDRLPFMNIREFAS